MPEDAPATRRVNAAQDGRTGAPDVRSPRVNSGDGRSAGGEKEGGVARSTQPTRRDGMCVRVGEVCRGARWYDAGDGRALAHEQRQRPPGAKERRKRKGNGLIARSFTLGSRCRQDKRRRSHYVRSCGHGWGVSHYRGRRWVEMLVARAHDRLRCRRTQQTGRRVGFRSASSTSDVSRRS